MRDDHKFVELNKKIDAVRRDLFEVRRIVQRQEERRQQRLDRIQNVWARVALTFNLLSWLIVILFVGMLIYISFTHN